MMNPIHPLFSYKFAEVYEHPQMIHCSGCETNIKYSNELRRKNKCRKCKTAFQYRCGMCGNLYKSMHALRYHQKVRCNKQPSLSCAHCDLKTRVKSDLIMHMEAKHLDLHSKNIHKCSICGNGYKYRKHMLYHERNCGKTAYLKCKFCSYTSNYSENLRKHVQRKHSKVNKELYQICYLCGKKYRYNETLRKHMKTCNETCASTKID